MTVFQIDPLTDSRWSALLAGHPAASVFHSTEWLEALRRTYEYEPVVYTMGAAGAELEDGVVFCRVRSWLTGRRLVSVPFADHCQPLVADPTIGARLLSAARREGGEYVELRPLAGAPDGDWGASERFVVHVLDLRPSLEALFRGFHRSCVQRKIRRAERERLAYAEGRSEALLRQFFGLMVRTRRRHGLPAQPLAWFRNLAECLGEHLTIRIVAKNGRPVAAILTLLYKQTLTYKYGGSEAAFHNLGGTSYLLWRAIQDGKARGAESFDLGRSGLENSGLIRFKEGLGAVRHDLCYYRSPAPTRHGARWERGTRLVQPLLSRLPAPCLTAAGRLLYRHVG